MFTIDDILRATGGSLRGDRGVSPKIRIDGVSIDSRTIRTNEFFVAIKGRTFDGHDFIDRAVKKGACGVVVAESAARDIPVVIVKDTLEALGDIAAYHRRRFDIPVTGVTGSNGKTTVKEMVSYILARRFNILKNIGTKNNLVGLPLTLLKLNKDHSVAVLEMGTNHSGEIGRLTEILKPTVGVITNIGPSHLEFLKDKEGVLKAKSEMVNKLGADDCLIINGDDRMLSRIKSKRRIIRFGLKRENDFRATDIDSIGGISFKLNNRYTLTTGLLGAHNVYNLLAAIAVASQFISDISAISSSLSDFRLPKMRMECEEIKGINVINDTYNSNPLSLECAIRTLSDFRPKGKKILVSGDMLELGKKGRHFHELAGRLIATSSIDALIAVGQLSQYTAKAARDGGMEKKSLWLCPDAYDAARLLKNIAQPGDTVLVKGSREMAMEEIIDGLR